MKRRTAIGLTVCGGVAGLPGCHKNGGGSDPNLKAEMQATTTEKETKSDLPPREGEDLVPVRVEESLEIRTITGLRPYRPSFRD